MFLFKKKEILMDFNGLRSFSIRVPGFEYVDSKLTLAPETSRFALELPFLNFSIDSKHPSRINRSRIVSGIMRTLYTKTLDLISGDLIDHAVFAMRCVVKGSRFQHGDSGKFVEKIVDFNFLVVFGYIAPNSNEQVQVFKITPIEDIGEFYRGS